MHGAAGGVKRIAGERRAVIADFDGLAEGFWSENETHGGLSADGDYDALRLRSETFCGNFDGISGGRERCKVGFAVGVGGLFAMSGQLFRCQRNLCCGDGAAGGVHYIYQERATEFLRGERGRRSDQDNESDD